MVYSAYRYENSKGFEPFYNERKDLYNWKDDGWRSACEGSAWKGNLVVDGIGDIAEEINKLKTDIEKIKKKIKKPNKKTVIKESV